MPSVISSRLPRVDAYSMRLFVTTAQEGSIARAAEREHIAASALSRRIADLEHALGVALLLRSPRGIELTEAGQHLLVQGMRIDDDLRALVHTVQSLGSEVVGTVRLFANASAIVGFLPERLKAFSVAHPQVRIALQEHRSWEVVRACMEDRADVGIAVAGGIEVPRSLESWHFAFDPLMVVLPPGHPLASRERLRFAEVAAYGLVGVQEGGSLDQFIRERADAARLSLEFNVTVNGFDAACRMVEAGLGIAVVPTSAAAAYAGTSSFCRRPLDEPWIGRELRLHALRKSPRRRAVGALIETLEGRLPTAG